MKKHGPNFYRASMEEVFQYKALDSILGSETRARTLRFFFRHEGETFRVGEVAKAILENYNTTASFIEELGKILVLKEVKGKGSGSTYAVNFEFPSYVELKEFVLHVFPVSVTQITERIKQTGKIRMALLEGIFLNQESSSIDLFVVADDIDQKKFNEFVAGLEADVGKTINYTLMDTSEFTYRYNIYDRFVRNILKKPNIKLIDNLSL